VVVSGQKHPPSSPKRLRKATKNKANQHLTSHLTQQTLNIFTLPSSNPLPLSTLAPGSRIEDIILNRSEWLAESTTAQPKPSLSSDYGTDMIQQYDDNVVDPLHQTIVDGDALSMAPEYDLDEL